MDVNLDRKDENKQTWNDDFYIFVSGNENFKTKELLHLLEQAKPREGSTPRANEDSQRNCHKCQQGWKSCVDLEDSLEDSYKKAKHILAILSSHCFPCFLPK